MKREDLVIVVVLALIIALFLIPTQINTGIFANQPILLAVWFVVLPVLAVVGMYIAGLISQKIKVLWQVAKFALVGVSNTAIDFGVLNFLILQTNYTQGTGIGLINAPSFLLAIINSYFWNRRWVFGDSKQGNFFVFAIITIIGLAINTSVIVGITTFITPLFGVSPTIWANIAKVFATAFSMVWNFAGYKLIVFRR